MAYHIVMKLVGLSFDILANVDNFIFLAEFVVLYCEVAFEMPIILWKLFLVLCRVLVDMEKGDLKFMLNDEEVKFNVRKTMKHLIDIRVVLVINYVDDPRV